MREMNNAKDKGEVKRYLQTESREMRNREWEKNKEGNRRKLCPKKKWNIEKMTKRKLEEKTV